MASAGSACGCYQAQLQVAMQQVVRLCLSNAGVCCVYVGCGACASELWWCGVRGVWHTAVNYACSIPSLCISLAGTLLDL